MYQQPTKILSEPILKNKTSIQFQFKQAQQKLEKSLFLIQKLVLIEF